MNESIRDGHNAITAIHGFYSNALGKCVAEAETMRMQNEALMRSLATITKEFERRQSLALQIKVILQGHDFDDECSPMKMVDELTKSIGKSSG